MSSKNLDICLCNHGTISWNLLLIECYHTSERLHFLSCPNNVLNSCISPSGIMFYTWSSHLFTPWVQNDPFAFHGFLHWYFLGKKAVFSFNKMSILPKKTTFVYSNTYWEVLASCVVSCDWKSGDAQLCPSHRGMCKSMQSTFPRLNCWVFGCACRLTILMVNTGTSSTKHLTTGTLRKGSLAPMRAQIGEGDTNPFCWYGTRLEP